MDVSVSTDGVLPCSVAKGRRNLGMLLIMGSWRGADVPRSGALVGLSLTLLSIQASGERGCGVCGGICLTWNGLKEEELEKALKSLFAASEPAWPCSLPREAGGGVYTCTPAHHTCTPAHHTCTPQMHPLLCSPPPLCPQTLRIGRGPGIQARSGDPTWLLSIQTL